MQPLASDKNCLWCRAISVPVVQQLSEIILASIPATACEAQVRVGTIMMHAVQDAIAAVYYLLQYHGTYMAAAGSQGTTAIVTAASAMLRGLQVWASGSVTCTPRCSVSEGDYGAVTSASCTYLLLLLPHNIC